MRREGLHGPSYPEKILTTCSESAAFITSPTTESVQQPIVRAMSPGRDRDVKRAETSPCRQQPWQPGQAHPHRPMWPRPGSMISAEATWVGVARQEV